MDRHGGIGRLERRFATFGLLAALLIAPAAAGAAEIYLASGLPLDASSPAPEHRLPVLFVHGHNATDDDADFNYQKNFWNPLNGRPAMRDALELPQNDGLDIEAYYIRFVDQDRSITDDAADIAEAVGAILHRHDPSFDPADPTDTTPVQLAVIAYSKGTISTRQYLKSLQVQVPGLPAPRPDFRPVSEFVAISPPNHGIETLLFALNPGLSLRQLYNGYRPDGLAFDCGDPFNTPAATDYIEILNGHPIGDTLTEPFADFASEAPGSRADGAPPTDGVLYVTLYASGNRDFVGGDDASGDCQGRKVARNLAPQAVNIPMTEVTGSGELGIHQNTVHTPEVICLALYAVVHHRSPLGQSCGYDGDVPIVPLPARAAAMLALDMSGSMLAPACPGCSSRLEVLQDSAELFVQLWSLLGRPEDRLGVTYFRTNVDQPVFGGTPLPLLIGNEAALIGDIAGQQTVPGNMTAMGGGLQRAIEALDASVVQAESRHVILFTDGMQNVNPMVRALSAAPPRHEIATVPGRPASNVTPTVPPTRLDTLPGITVDTIGIGAGQAFLDLLADIATQSGGRTKATIAPDDDLRRFFVEELINALRGFSPQLVAYRRGMVATGGRATETFTVNGGARRLVLKLSWRRGEKLSFRVLSNGVDVTSSGRIVAGPFYRIFALDLPAGAAARQWQMAISGRSGVAYEAAAIVDEHRLRYDIAFDRAAALVGEPLELVTRLAVDGKALVRDVTVEALVRRPRVAAGNVIAGAAATPPPGEPGQGTGERRLLALAGDKLAWERLAPTSERVVLRHAGGGVYRAQLKATVPGIYMATLLIKGRHAALGTFERSETATAVVRFGAAALARSALRLRDRGARGAESAVELVLQPQDRFGNLLGPGLAATVTATLSAGRIVGGAQDLGDGRYLFLFMLPKGTDPKLTLAVGQAEFYRGTITGLRRLLGG